MVGKHWTFVIIIAVALMAGVVIGRHAAMPIGAVYITPGPGCESHIITDRTMADQKSGRAAELSGAGIPVRRHRRHKIEHNKFAIFDNRRIATGSFNWTDNATKYNSENRIFLDTLAAEYSTRFDYLWDMYGE